jgi:glutaminyl-peptide cyclotransferase
MLALAGALVALPACAATPEYGYRVVHRFAHDPDAFTEGLFLQDGRLFESTGLVGKSWVREIELATGRVLRQREVPPPYFGEGIVAWRGKLVQLTWRSQTGFIYDLQTFRPLGTFRYPGEGWALTTDGRRLIMSDGTPTLRFLDPNTLKQSSALHVTDEGRPVMNLNELEWVKGEIYANVWGTDRIARIDPRTGAVKGWIDLAGLAAPEDRRSRDDVLNGIAYDAAHDRLYVTGKNWSTLFEIVLTPKSARGS